ncbi:MAG: molybdate ABC transporter permease subunit [Acidimicrobiia bacterium]|nr:molybdate ABC transporter permease subunit [Acidimicrobiia bacterium]MYC46440.1 molybdate ABC transporter permease subunit [Acidimicrobiia bacterium]MYI19892.1 molybdate ABC transporter permease subunit [Acidimicrobiia bacterium]
MAAGTTAGAPAVAQRRRELRQRRVGGLWLPAGVALALLVVPIIGLLQRAPWGDLPALLGSARLRDALVISAVTSAIAAGASMLLGLPLALALSRCEPTLRRLVRVAVLLPMVLPPVVGGTALLFALGRRGLVGQWLDSWLGWSLPFSTAGVVVAATFVAMPFFVITAEAGLRSADAGLVEAARTLGARRSVAFRRVTLPQVAPSLAAGAALAWARALGEFGATITFAGNLRGRTQTLPLATFEALEAGRPAEAIALSVVLLAVSVVVLVSLRDRWLTR